MGDKESSVMEKKANKEHEQHEIHTLETSADVASLHRASLVKDGVIENYCCIPKGDFKVVNCNKSQLSVSLSFNK